MILKNICRAVSCFPCDRAGLVYQISRELRPDYVIHGDNWLSGPTKLIRDNAKSALDSYGGKIIDIPYTYNENIKKIEKKVQAKLMMPEFRRKRLKQLLSSRPIVKAIEARNGLTGLILSGQKWFEVDDLNDLRQAEIIFS